MNAIAAEIGISSGSITKWKQGGEPSERLVSKVASYFGVSPEEMVSINLNFRTAFSDEEIELIKAFRKLNSIGKQQAMTQMMDLTQIERYTEDTALTGVS